MTPTTVCYEYSNPDSNSNHSKYGGGHSGGQSGGFLRPLSEHHYEQPMVILPPSQNSPSDSLDKPTTTGSRYVLRIFHFFIIVNLIIHMVFLINKLLFDMTSLPSFKKF